MNTIVSSLTLPPRTDVIRDLENGKMENDNIKEQRLKSLAINSTESMDLTERLERREEASNLSGNSLNEMYGLEAGFSEKQSIVNGVDISDEANILLMAEKNRKIFSPDGHESALSESLDLGSDIVSEYSDSKDGSVIFRRVNSKALGQIKTVEEALAIYEQIQDVEAGKIVIFSEKETMGLVVRAGEIDSENKMKARKLVEDGTQNFVSAFAEFKDNIVAADSSLKNVDLDIGLDGDKIKVVSSALSGAALSPDEIKLIEDIANDGSVISKKLIKSMSEIRESSIKYHNIWSGVGRENPVGEEDFFDNFGGFVDYVDSIEKGEGGRFKDKSDLYTFSVGYAASRLL